MHEVTLLLQLRQMFNSSNDLTQSFEVVKVAFVGAAGRQKDPAAKVNSFQQLTLAAATNCKTWIQGNFVEEIGVCCLLRTIYFPLSRTLFRAGSSHSE
jgi:hypothetical protein